MSEQAVKTWSISGGIHPVENKEQSNQVLIESGPRPSLLVLPVRQHIGSSSKLLVKIGERVLAGQRLAKADGFISAHVHAPASGEIVDIRAHTTVHPSSISETCIFLKTDAQDQWVELDPIIDPLSQPPMVLINKIADAGITGMGGAGFPTHVKYPGNADHIDTLIINGTECEPYITADDRLMRERADEIVQGTLIIEHILKPKHILVGIEDNKPEAILAMQAAVDAHKAKHIRIRVFPTKYPSGGEKQLIYILTGKELPKGKIPADIGMVCQNVGTVAAIYQAIVHGYPLTRRITTVTGDSGGKLGNYDILIGTQIIDLLTHCQWQQKKAQRVIIGGPMMGFTVTDLSAPLIKNANCVLVPSKRELPKQNPANPCIRCGMCEQVCPAGLLPQQLHWYAKSNDFEKAELANLADCIECGACSYVCPSQIPLVQYFRYAKGEIAQEKNNLLEAERAKERYEARQARLEKAEAEKEAKRKARADKAAKAKTAKQTGKASPDAQLIAAAKAKVAASKQNKTTEMTLDQLKELAKKAQEKVDKAQLRLQQAKQDAPETVNALEKAIEKLQQKALSSHQSVVNASKQTQSAAMDTQALKQKLEKAKIKADKAKQRIIDAQQQQPELVEVQQQAYEKFVAKVLLAQKALDAALSANNASVLSGSVHANDPSDTHSQMAALQKKIDKAQARLEKAKVDKPHLVEGIVSTIEGFKQKIAQLQSTVQGGAAGIETKSSTTSPLTPNDSSTSQEAIVKLQQKIDKAQARLEKAKVDKPHLVEGIVSTIEGFKQKQAQLSSPTPHASNKRAVEDRTESLADLQKIVDKLQQKIEKAELRLEQAKTDKPHLVQGIETNLAAFKNKHHQAVTNVHKFKEQFHVPD